MGEDTPVLLDHGFVYILSNDSMQGIFKVGITTNTVRQRMRELNATGVPTPFRAEKIFQVQLRHLSSVERHAHKKLKDRGLHQGKEFFRAQLSACVAAVEDSIHELTGASCHDLVGLAKQRAEIERQERERAKERAEQEAAARQSLRARLDSENMLIGEQRKAWIDSVRSADKPGPLGRVFNLLALTFGAVFFLAMLYLFVAIGGFWGALIYAGTGWWLFSMAREQARSSARELEKQAAERLPLKTLESEEYQLAATAPRSIATLTPKPAFSEAITFFSAMGPHGDPGDWRPSPFPKCPSCDQAVSVPTGKPLIIKCPNCSKVWHQHT